MLKEKCGIVGFYSPRSVKQLRLVLYSAGGVQHRGQQGAGIAALTKEGVIKYTDNGLLKEIFTPKVMKRLNRPSFWTLVHCRYGTFGGYNKSNLQPCLVNSKNGETFAVIHNGEFVKTAAIRKKLLKNLPETTSDTYLFTQLLAQINGESTEEKIVKSLLLVKGAYSIIIGVDNALYAARDPFGIRPLILGKIKDRWIVASETHALAKVGAKIIRTVDRGEIIKIDRGGLKTVKRGIKNVGNFCDFEWAYFSRPDSLLPFFGKSKKYYQTKNWSSVLLFRESCGIVLAKEKPIKNASFVVGIPDSGISMAIGYANTLKLPYRQVIVRDHYDRDGNQRLFMRDDQIKKIRKKVLGKLSIISDISIWKNAVVVIGDDSIVRGNVSAEITKAIFSLGAREVHWVLGFPPVRFRCHLGVSIRTGEELVACLANGDSFKVAKILGATSVHYISPLGFTKARTLNKKVTISYDPREIFLRNGGCGGCITGLYPINQAGKVYEA